MYAGTPAGITQKDGKNSFFLVFELDLPLAMFAALYFARGLQQSLSLVDALQQLHRQTASIEQR